MRKENNIITNENEAIHKESKAEDMKDGELGKTSKKVYYVNYYPILCSMFSNSHFMSESNNMTQAAQLGDNIGI